MGLGQIDRCGMALVGCGSAVPAISVSNQQLSERVDTSDEWIRTRTGIGARRICAADEPLTVLASRAAQAALDHAGWSPEDLDLILLATSSPDDLFGTAPRVQGALGASRAVAFDLTAACSGFLFALITASQYLRSGAMRRALVIGADQLSRWVDWDDRSTCVLFGDGAGAVAVQACPAAEGGLLGFRMHSDGSRNGCLTLAQTDSHTDVAGNQALYNLYFIWAMNKDVYEGLPDDLRAVIDANSGLEFSAFAGRTQQEYDAPGRALAAERGNTVITLDAAQVAAWRAASQPTITNWIAEATAAGLDGQGIYDDAVALIAKNNAGN